METLIAIAILMVAIAGPLTVANQALTAALGSRNAMIATSLAQDGMESIRNIKDNAVATQNNVGWLNLLNQSSCTSNDNGTTGICTVPDRIHAGSPQACASCKLYVDTSAGSPNNYNYVSDTKTPFRRYFYFSHVTSGSPSEAIVTVVVSWSDGSVPNQIQLQELMTDAPR